MLLSQFLHHCTLTFISDCCSCRQLLPSLLWRLVCGLMKPEWRNLRPSGGRVRLSHLLLLPNLLLSWNLELRRFLVYQGIKKNIFRITPDFLSFSSFSFGWVAKLFARRLVCRPGPPLVWQHTEHQTIIAGLTVRCCTEQTLWQISLATSVL